MILSKKVARSVTGFVPMSERIIMLQILTTHGKMNLIQIYAPTADKNEEEIENFYSELQKTLHFTASRDITVIMGDCNAKIGEGKCYLNNSVFARPYAVVFGVVPFVKIEMEDLKKKRKPLKAKITRIANWLLENADAETDGLQFQLRHTELKTCYLKYEEVMDQIEEIDETDTETEDRVLMEEKYFSTLAGLQHKMEALKLPSHSLSSNSTPPTVATAKVRLPEITMQERFNFVKGKKLCWNCLGNKHFSQDCNSSRSCSICKKRHHSLLHSTSENVSSSRNTNRQSFSIDRNAQAPKHSQGSSSRVAHTSTPPSYNAHTQNEASTSSFKPPLEVQNTADSHTATSLSALSVKTDVLLATALVTVYSKDGRPMHARALLDNGSQHSFISRDLVEKLNLTPYFKQLQISTISENTSLSNQMITIEFFPYNVKDRSFKTSFAVLDSITCRLPKAALDRSKINVPPNLTLADPSYSVPGKIDLLLAGDIYSELLTDGFIRLGKNLPILQNTHLGYVIFGTIPPHVFHRSSNLAISQSNVSLFVQSDSEENNLDKLIQQFFEIEEVPHVSKLTPDEELAEQIFNKTTRILPSGRFQVSCSLLASKSRVAPLKPLTLPRLELMGALLCSKLTAKIANIVKEKLSQLDSINMWSDSEIVLAWLRSHPSRWTQFVANRVAQILDNSPNAHWRHVRSKENPADILSRGMLPSEIINSSLWFHGPPFLNQLRLDLLKYNPKGYTSKLPEERKIILHARNDQIDFFTSLSDRFSNFSKFVRTLAFMFRFANNAKPLSRKLTDTLEVSELQNAELKIIKMLQYSNFSSEISELKKGKTLSNKCLLPLNPFLDENEMLRVGGRLRNSDVTFDQRYPLLLPSKNRVVRLILHREHVRLCHSGPQNTLSQIRLKYWPLNGLREVKKVTHQCMVCFKFRAKPATQIMADLPKERLNSSRVFAHVGLDFGGPFQIKVSNLRKAPLLKSYIALFVCLSTRAVHIEVVSGLSTETFLLALKRFISRRGLPQTIFSDNATNFLGARNQLFELYKFFKEKESSRSIKEFLASSHIRWKTIVPRAPHHGGIWESAIKSAKHHMRRLLGNVKLTFEEFTTVLGQIEAVLNSRPLCSLSNDPSDFTYLTPGHFLIGQSLTSFPEKDVIHIPENRLNLWQHLSKLQQVFWKKWSIDYLNRLQNRPKWFLPHKNLEPNDLVLLIEDNTPPLHWVLARVIEVFPGKDGRVRIASVKTKDGVFKRSITKLCPLPNDDLI
ncbi:uncharacterized protein [Diabrotica undecimpunctata]|uniref:uncharacterized protein n=1 Tax=Diabrotica undecimpunctata TaxID=50387 RepID=UPI003B63E740